MSFSKTNEQAFELFAAFPQIEGKMYDVRCKMYDVRCKREHPTELNAE